MDKNQTIDDARARLYLARLGSLADQPTLEYLHALRLMLHDWLGEIGNEIARAEARSRALR